MKKSIAIKHFGSVAALARALHLTPGAVSQWGVDVPKLRAVQLERITDGALRATRGDYGLSGGDKARAS